MTEPVRLLASDATEFERLLLGAAARERPTRRQTKRMHLALALAEFGIIGTAGKAVAAISQHLTVVAVVATSLLGNTSTPSMPSPRQAIEGPMKPAIRPTFVPGSDQVGPREQSASAVEVTDDNQRAPAGVSTNAKPEATSTAAAAPRRLPDLREEIAIMDQARTAMRLGAPIRALGTLEQYRHRFPRGSFGQEALALQVEALAASGNRSKAVGLAKEFLTRHPDSPYSDRLRRIVTGNSTEAR